jgi:hypothetical protein
MKMERKFELSAELKAKLLFFLSSLSTVGWNRFQNSFFIDKGLSNSQIGSLKSLGLLCKAVGEPILSLSADLLSTNSLLMCSLLVHIVSLEYLRIHKNVGIINLMHVKLMRTFCSPQNTLTTSTVLKLIGTSTSNQGYGEQRAFGSLAWGSGALGVGFAIDHFGMNSMFISCYVFSFLFLLCIFCFDNHYKSPPSGTVSEISDEESSSLRNSTAASPSVAKPKTSDLLKQYVSIITKSQVRWLFANVFIYGVCMTVVDSFLYIYAERDLGASRAFGGSLTAASIISTVPLFWYRYDTTRWWFQKI